MSSRKNAARLFWKSRRTYFNNESVKKALDQANQALSYLSEDEISPRFAEWLVFLYTSNRMSVPSQIIERIPQTPRFLAAHMGFLFSRQQTHEAIALFNILSENGNYYKGKKELMHNDLLSIFVVAEMLFASKEKEKAFDIISSNLKKCDEKYTGIKTKLVLAKAYVILGKYYQELSMTTLAEAMMRKAFSMIETSTFFFLTAGLYVRIADFYVTNFPSAKGINILERISQISHFFPDKKMFLQLEMQWLYYFIYSGETENFWKRLKEMKQMARSISDTDGLAAAYYLESMFHMYNKDIISSDAHIKKALELQPPEDLIEKCERLSIVAAFMIKGDAVGASRLAAISPESKAYGFDDFIDFYTISDEDELADKFKSFFKHDLLWKEEITLCFCEKFTKYFPELYQNTVKNLIIEYKHSGLKLTQAMLDEALGMSYLYQNNLEDARFYLSRAQNKFKKIGYLNSLKRLQEITPADETDIVKLRGELEGFIVNSGNAKMIANFNKFKTSSDKNISRLNAMNEILDFVHNIDINDNIKQTLQQILYWINSFSKAQISYMALFENDVLKDQCALNYSNPKSDSYLIDILQTPDHIEFFPLNIKKTFIVDEKRKLVLYLENERINSAIDTDFIRIFLNYMEPVLVLFAKNSLYLQNSMYDSLTGLYSRWYYEERFKEEHEKALRYQLPLSFIMGDLDSFKAVNDTYGHQTGDEVLKEISKIIVSHTRKFDIVGRYGGEEFSIILPNTTIEGALTVAEKIRVSVENILIFPFNTSISFGVHTMDKGQYEDYKILEKRSDMALYAAKRSGKNCVKEFKEDMNSEYTFISPEQLH